MGKERTKTWQNTQMHEIAFSHNVVFCIFCFMICNFRKAKIFKSPLSLSCLSPPPLHLLRQVALLLTICEIIAIGFRLTFFVWSVLTDWLILLESVCLLLVDLLIWAICSYVVSIYFWNYIHMEASQPSLARSHLWRAQMDASRGPLPN